MRTLDTRKRVSMACMLKAVLIAFAAFGVAERLSASHEAALDEHASSDVPAEQTKIRSSEATVRNAFQEFWECHSVAWTFRSTDGIYQECKRQYREDQNATGVLLQESYFHHYYNRTFTAKYYWRYHGNDSAFTDGTFEEGNRSTCRTRPHYELLVDDDHTDDVPGDCTAKYNDTITRARVIIDRQFYNNSICRILMGQRNK
uniref:Lipocalin n=1 Tax=Rhipicephalus zambeziensis TaxID=60191 RepID=A0A224YBH3_9ACAR